MRAESGPYPASMVLDACQGVLLQGDASTVFDAISTDSRDIRAGDLFVPLKGTTFDGHEFVLPALEAGARGSLVDRGGNREIPHKLTNQVLIQVQDTLRALSDLASAYRKSYTLPLIAVTGSSGKTTVKEMIAAVLGRSHHPLVSQGNLNNMIGLPMTVLNLNGTHTVAVVEAGVNTVGEMKYLARAASPDVAVITTIGPVHLEGLGSIEQVASEKFELVRSVRAQGTAVMPHGNEYLESHLKEARCTVVSFGIEHGDYRAAKIRETDGNRFEMIAPSGTVEVSLSVAGRHNVANALAAAAACVAVGVPLAEVSDTLRGFEPPTWRMEILALSGGRILIRDCYNANPQSMKSALQVLSTRGRGRPRLALLADMMELGAYSGKLHQELGEEVARLGIDRVVFVGEYGEQVAQGFSAAGGNSNSVLVFDNKQDAWKAIRPDIKNFGAILVKGSRVTKMETMAQNILEEN
ncbi:MAG: UDP-N-acetylmuramoyl-tripeptide--D-alanyl-D-alanine ligase [Thermodesulfobacteriota bacterium]